MFQVNHIVIRYGDRSILEASDLSLERGKVYTVYGSSGVGKSSLLNKIGMIAPFDGQTEYFFDGKKIDSQNPDVVSAFISQEIGYIFQNQNLLRDITVYDNLALPLQYRGESHEKIDRKIEQVLEELNIADLKFKYPTELSGGEEQRVAIARTLVADKTIILADEPTNSLDRDNSENVIELLVNLAREHDKIVLIVSHDEQLIKQGDVVFTIKDKKLINTTEVKASKPADSTSKSASDAWSPVLTKYHSGLKLNKKTTPLPKILTLLIALVVAISILAVNFNKLFKHYYQNLVDDSLENAFMVISDPMESRTQKVIDDFPALSDNLRSKIEESAYIDEVKPYLEFVYHGLTLENAPKFLEQHAHEQAVITLNGERLHVLNPYSVQALYKTNVTERNMISFDTAGSEGVYVSEDYITKANLKDIKAGSHVKLNLYVPIALYDLTMESEGQEIKGDGDLYVKIERDFEILGIVKSQYPFSYSIYDNSFFMDIDQMLKIQKEAAATNSVPQEMDGYKIRPWQTAAMHLTLKESLHVPDEIERIKGLSDELSVVSTYENYSQFQQSIDSIKHFILVLSFVLLLIVSSALFFAFYLMNNSRKLEVGILKALGIRRNSILMMYLKELILYGCKIAAVSAVFLLTAIAAAYFILQLNSVDILYFALNSLIGVAVLSVLVSVASGLLPIYKASKETVIDTIRLNR